MPKDSLKYNLFRSNRKTYALEVSPSGTLTVRVPNHYSDIEVSDIITRHRNWIEQNVVKTKRKIEKAGLDKFFKNKQVFFRGDLLDVMVIITNKNKVELSKDRLIVYKRENIETKKLITNWLKERARDLFTEKLNHFSNTFGLSYQSLKLSNAKKRWGSCSSKKNINLSWRLVMAEDILIDSVILHELAHTVHMNHSSDFYDLLSRMNPDYLKHDVMIRDRFYLLNY